MYRHLIITPLLILWCCIATAELPIPEAAKAATDRYFATIEQFSHEYSSLIDTARKRHGEQVEQLIEKAKKAGDLDAVLKLEEEVKNVADSNSVSAKPPAIAVGARRGFDEAIRKSDAEFKRKARSSLDALLKELAELEKAETKADRIGSAKEVREYRIEREKAGPAKPVIPQSAAANSSAEMWIDLLEWAEGVDWTELGIDWNSKLTHPPSKQGITLKDIPGQITLYPFPAIVDGDYELDAEFTRLSGSRDVVITLPVGIHNVVLGFHEVADGLGMIDGTWFPDNNTTRRPGQTRTGQRHRVHVTVKRNAGQVHIQVDLDNNPKYITWTGKESSLVNLVPGLLWTTTGHPCVHSLGNVTEFHAFRIRMLSGTIEYDRISDADRAQDLKDGFVRLVGQHAMSPSVGEGKFMVNQVYKGGAGEVERAWPQIASSFNFCSDFYGAHAPSKLKCPVPKAAKSFSVIGTNELSKSTKFQVSFDGKQVYDSGMSGLSIIKLDIPPKAAILELVVDPAGDEGADHSYWCYPRFHAVTAEKITDKMLSGKTGPFAFNITSSSVNPNGTLTHNSLPLTDMKSGPIDFHDIVPCHEFLQAHAPSFVTYDIPSGMTRFTAIGYNVTSHSTRFEVWTDGTQIYESPPSGVVRIDVKLPPNSKTLKLTINSMGDNRFDESFWCYPRLYRK